MLTSDRINELRAIARRQVINALYADINGEQIMKEAWENCEDQAEMRVMESELRAMIACLEAMQ